MPKYILKVTGTKNGRADTAQTSFRHMHGKVKTVPIEFLGRIHYFPLHAYHNWVCM